MALTGKRILVVEDTDVSATSIANALKKNGAVVLGPAPTAFYASQLVGKRPVDAAIISANLKTADAATLANELAANGVSIIVLATDPASVANYPGVTIAREAVADYASFVAQIEKGLSAAVPASPKPPTAESKANFVRTTEPARARLLRVHTQAMRRGVTLN